MDFCFLSMYLTDLHLKAATFGEGNFDSNRRFNLKLLLLAGIIVTDKAYQNSNANGGEIYDQALHHFFLDLCTTPAEQRKTFWLSNRHERWIQMGGYLLLVMRLAERNCVKAPETSDPLSRASFWRGLVRLPVAVQNQVVRFALPNRKAVIHGLFVKYCCPGWNQKEYLRLLAERENSEDECEFLL